MQSTVGLDMLAMKENEKWEYETERTPKNTRPSDFDTGGLCVLGNQNGYLSA
jgi:hypothetical protein